MAERLLKYLLNETISKKLILAHRDKVDRLMECPGWNSRDVVSKIVDEKEAYSI